MDKVAKLEAVRRRASKAFHGKRVFNGQLLFSLMMAIAVLPQYEGLKFQKRYILINRVLQKIENEGSAKHGK